MPRYFFDLSHSGDVYHDAQGTMFRGPRDAKERAFEMVRRLAAHPEPRDIVCTVRDAFGHELMSITFKEGAPVVCDASRMAGAARGFRGGCHTGHSRELVSIPSPRAAQTIGILAFAQLLPRA